MSNPLSWKGTGLDLQRELTADGEVSDDENKDNFVAMYERQALHSVTQIPSLLQAA